MYQTYEFAIEHKDGLKFIKVVACDHHAAQADVIEAFGGFVSMRLL